MKRSSSLRRKTELKAASGPQRKPMRRKPKAKSASDCRWRSPEYLAFVRSLPCCVCGGQANAAHHLIGMWSLSGMGLKAPDSYVMPVCDGPGDTCHRRIHNEQALRRQQPEWLVDTINRGLDRFTGEPTVGELCAALEFIAEREGE